MAKITVTIAPTQGKTKKVTLEATGAPLRAVLEKAGYDADKFDVKVAGKSVDLDAFVKDGADVTLTERVKGS